MKTKDDEIQNSREQMARTNIQGNLAILEDFVEAHFDAVEDSERSPGSA